MIWKLSDNLQMNLRDKAFIMKYDLIKCVINFKTYLNIIFIDIMTQKKS